MRTIACPFIEMAVIEVKTNGDFIACSVDKKSVLDVRFGWSLNVQHFEQSSIIRSIFSNERAPLWKGV